MIPVYYFLTKPKFKFGKKEIINTARFYKRFIFFQKIPDFLGLLIDILPINHFEKKFCFFKS